MFITKYLTYLFYHLSVKVLFLFYLSPIRIQSSLEVFLNLKIYLALIQTILMFHLNYYFLYLNQLIMRMLMKLDEVFSGNY